MNTQTIVSEIANGLQLLEGQKRRDYLIRNNYLLKKTVPFSSRLNEWIANWYDRNKVFFRFTKHDDFDPEDIEGTFQRHKKRFEESGVISIWTGASEGTIFGDPTINHKFRAWHDYIHLTHNLGYDFIGESITANVQASQLPNDWLFERELVLCEVVGQAQYNMMTGEFVEDQRQFTVDYLQNPCKTVLTNRKLNTLKPVDGQDVLGDSGK